MSDLQIIKEEYQDLSSLPLDSDAASKRRRSFAFERLLNKLFTLEDLEPRAGYRPAGEQIYGSIYLDGRIYWLEAKWHADPLPAFTLYQFKEKWVVSSPVQSASLYPCRDTQRMPSMHLLLAKAST